MATDKKSYNILIVEDNPGDFVLVEDLLFEKMKYPTLSHAKNFSSAKRFLSIKDKKFDVVILDISLPDKTGEALVLEMVALCKKTPIIILTGFADFSFGLKALSLGVADYIFKDDLTSGILYKSIIYSLERKRTTTALEESEKKYSELFHLSPLPMFVFDQTDLKILNVNKAALKHYQYTREEFLGMALNDISLADDMQRIEEALFSSRDQKQISLPGTYRHKKKNGEIIQVEISGNAIPYKGKNAKVILAIDVTERVNYIKAVEEQNEKLREISWIQSHVVRAPLARILGLISLIKDLKANGIEKAEIMDYLEISANELDQVIREITNKTNVPESLKTEQLML
jgi:PAS domain S-box-containing protein